MILPEYRWWAAEPLWRMTEEYGFSHAWTYDHIGWRSLVDKPWFDAVPTLTAAANATSTIRLGMLVASPNFRHPVHFARELTALDDVSDGRITLGIGAGGGGFDTEVLGGQQLTPGQRTDRFGEFLELLDRVLSTDVTDYSGEYYSAVGARRAPGCVQQPRMPFVVAANGRRSMELAARYGRGWVTTGSRDADDEDSWWRSLRELSKRFDDAVTGLGGEPRRLPRYLQADAGPTYSMSSTEHFRDVLGQAEELGFTDVITHWPRTEEPYAGTESTVEDIASEVLPQL